MTYPWRLCLHYLFQHCRLDTSVLSDALNQGCYMVQGRPKGEPVSAAMQPRKILFINDVAFCAKDALRLLSHSADIACGVDFAHYEVGPHHIRGNSV